MQTETQSETAISVPETDLLAAAGFAAAAESVKKQRTMARKLRIAFEFHRIVTPGNIKKFQDDLKTKTLKMDGKNQWGNIETYDRLLFTKVEDYKECPPREVLEEVKKAKARGIFDRFEVATIQSVTTVPDPIVFGVIDGCENKFFVAQWGSDVSIEQLLAEDEG